MQPATYSAAVVTFRRAESLRSVLRSLLHQTQPPALVVIADNDPDESGRSVVESLAGVQGTRFLYVPLGDNLGPAGGWARAASVASVEPDRGEWLAVVDDDDPIIDTSAFHQLVVLAEAAPSRVGAIGLRGARLSRTWGTLTRVHPPSGSTGVADYLASGGAPLYRWSAIDAVGFFDEQLFFGFEDLELGLRLRAHGMAVVVADIGSAHDVADTAPGRSPWREYYKSRALVVICRRHLGAVALVATLGRSLVLGAVPLLARERSFAAVAARWRGALDGCRGRLGPQGWAPRSNPTKATSPSPSQPGAGTSQAAANDPHT